MTYSIVARDPETGQLGVGSESHYFALGRVVGWAESGVGAVATQAFVNVDYGPAAVAAMRSGSEPKAITEAVTGADELASYRQLGIVDAQGRVASYTGNTCVPACGNIVGDGFSVQGNMLTSDAVLPAMAEGFRTATGDLAERILAAMTAAEKAGGDARGSQSAMLKVVSGTRSASPWQEVIVDLRVDDHADPIGELTRLLRLHRGFALLGSVTSVPNVVRGPYLGLSEEMLAENLEGLEHAAELIGPGNREADFWRALLLARSGNKEAAQPLFDDLFAYRPQLREFLSGMGPLGFLDDAKDYVG